MLISRTVTVKSRVTAALRSQLGFETQRALRELEGELLRLEKLGKSSSKGHDVSHLGKKLQELMARKESLLGNLREIVRLKDGQEIVRGQIQGFCNLKVGDLWPDVLSCEIVLEDDKVVAIREGDNITLALNLQETCNGADADKTVESQED